MSRPLSIALAVSVSLHAAALALVLTRVGAPQEQPVVLAVEVVWGGESGAQSGGGAPARLVLDIAADSAEPLAHPSRRDFAEREIAPQDEGALVARPHPEEPIAAAAAIGVSKDGPLAPTDSDAGRVAEPHHPALSPQGLTRGPSSDLSARDTVSLGKSVAGSPDQVRGRQLSGGKSARAETIETAESRFRRQAVAARSIDSRHAESQRRSHEPAARAPAGATAHSASRDLDQSGGRFEHDGDSPAPGTSNAVAGSGEAVYRIVPAYPPAARRRGIEGSVLLRVRFDAAGRPEDIAVAASSGSEMLDHAARDAVQRWRFRGGVSGTVDVPVAFRLRGADAVQVTDAAGRGK